MARILEKTYPAKCPRCGDVVERFMSSGMKMGFNWGIGRCPKCSLHLALRMTGDADSMEAAPYATHGPKWNEEALAAFEAKQHLSPHLEPVE